MLPIAPIAMEWIDVQVEEEIEIVDEGPSAVIEESEASGDVNSNTDH